MRHHRNNGRQLLEQRRQHPDPLQSLQDRLLFRPDRRRNLIHSPLHRRIRARLDDVRQHANDTWVRLAFANAVLADGSLSI